VTFQETDTDDLARTFERIAELVRSEAEPLSCWSKVLKITGQRSEDSVASLDIVSDIASIARRLALIFAMEPLPAGVTFLWFGLFDRIIEGDQVQGYYVSGYTGASPEDGCVVYMPGDRYLTSAVLNSISAAVERIRNSTRHKNGQVPDGDPIRDYALMFGAAAILTKFAILSLTVRLPIYVGFDSGDFALIANPPHAPNHVNNGA
jgi:hypothetical protein